MPAITTPGVINAPGDYYLANDLLVSAGQLTNGAALSITAAGVRLNLNGCTIRGHGLDPNVASYGIYGQATNNLVVFDGQVGGVTGFWCGIWSDTPWTRIQEVVLSGNTYIGAAFTQHSARVYYCVVDGIQGTTNEAYAIGLMFHGPRYLGTGMGCEFRGNTIRELYRQPGAAASLVGEGIPVIVSSGSGGGLIEGNWFENSREEPETIGMFCAGGPSEARRNTIIGYQSGVMAGGSTAAPMTATFNTVRLPVPLDGSCGITSGYGLTEDNLIVYYETPLGIAPTGHGNTVVM